MDIFKKLFGFNKPKPALGAVIDEIDSRDFVMTNPKIAMMFSGAYPDYFKVTRLYALPVQNQQGNGSCVGQAEGEVVQTFEDGDNEVSRRDLYAHCKKQDGISSQGTSPRVASNIMKDHGVASARFVPNINTLSHSEYIKVDDTLEIIEDRAKRKILSYVSVPNSLEMIKQALYRTNAVCITVPVDWSRGWLYGTSGHVSKPQVVIGHHRVILSMYDGDTIYFKNSWGKEWGTDGFGKFSYEDMKDHIYDIRAYVDLPKETIEDLKKDLPGYVFTTTMRKGSRGNEVIQLQKVLGLKADGIFGNMTHAKVQEFQRSYNLVPDGIVGKATRNILNTGSKEEPKATVREFALALQQFEGWFPGSMSYKNNNPGNLRWSPFSKRSYKGFAVFDTYEQGLDALIYQINIAVKGNSLVYWKGMTFLDFFSVYAPSSDGNQPRKYATFIAQKLKVGVDYKMIDLI